MVVPQFFIHCAHDFSLEQEGADEISVFRHIEEAIEQVWRLQQDREARLTVFDPQGAMIVDTLVPPVRLATV
jgi:hypothetical protein